MSRPRSRHVAPILIVAVLALTACNPPSNAPDAYDEVTKANFVQGCTGVVTEGTDPDAETSVIGEGADPSVCECRYEWFVDNVPFDTEAAEAAGESPDVLTFTELNRQLEDNPDSMPDDIKNDLAAACSDQASTTGTPEGQPSTTVAPSDTTVAPSDTAG